MVEYEVVVIGGGFGGLTAAKELAGSELKVCVIDRTNHHLFQPLLYQVATAALSPSDIATPLREVLRSSQNIRVMMGEVTGIDHDKRQVQLESGAVIGFKWLVVATGSRHSYFGHQEWEKLAPGLKTLTDAVHIRERLLLSFEKAERLKMLHGQSISYRDAAKYLNFVVVGGGPTGVEMAGAIAEIAHKTLFKDFRYIDPKDSRIYLLEGGPYLLSSYPKRLSKRAKRDLEKLGVSVLTEQIVTEISEEGVSVGELFIPSSNVIWAAGNCASPLVKSLPGEVNRAGAFKVEADLSIPIDEQIFVIGDAAASKDRKGNRLPAIAPVALQQGAYVAKIIKKQIPRAKRQPFRYLDKGSLATIGKAKAVGTVGKLQFTGFIAWLVWAVLHILYLVSFQSRISVMMQWISQYLLGKRASRLIYLTRVSKRQKQAKMEKNKKGEKKA